MGLSGNELFITIDWQKFENSHRKLLGMRYGVKQVRIKYKMLFNINLLSYFLL
jgi:hypothetical protein